jgi:Pyruvate/2-oxoacid:ferredoxin oxidoreductase delta subunit
MADGLAFLRRCRAGRLDPLQGSAAVIGGGNTAVDVARSLVRLGARPTIVYRRRRGDMPAYGEELAAALAEGVDLVELTAPVAIVAGAGRFELTLQRMRVSDHEISGRARVIPIEGETRTLSVDHLFRAVGAAADPGWLPPKGDTGFSLGLSHCTLAEGAVPTAFGGDLTNPARTVAHALASGKQAAMALDTWLREGRDAVAARLEGCRLGDGQALSMQRYLEGPRRMRSGQVVAFEELNPDYFTPAARLAPTPAEAVADPFAETRRTLAAEAAVAEAARCFNCGICDQCDNCRLFCPEVAVGVDTERRIDFDYCKGCGICAAECPRGVISLAQEGP